MATNKNAMARYRALDKCFSSRTRKYYMNDLIEACRMALERQNGDSGSKGAEGVQRRQIFDDMNDMELMYGVIIDRIKDYGRIRSFPRRNGLYTRSRRHHETL